MARRRGVIGTSRRRRYRQKAMAADMSFPVTTSAPEYPVMRPSDPEATTSSGDATPWCPRPAFCRARVTSAGSSAGKQRRGSISPSGSEQGQVAIQLELGHLRLVSVPLLALVADEPFEDVVAEGLGQQFGSLHFVDGIVQARWQLVDPLL